MMARRVGESGRPYHLMDCWCPVKKVVVVTMKTPYEYGVAFEVTVVGAGRSCKVKD